MHYCKGNCGCMVKNGDYCEGCTNLAKMTPKGNPFSFMKESILHEAKNPFDFLKKKKF